MSQHPLDKPILHDLFWFVVLPYRCRMWLAGEVEYQSWSPPTVSIVERVR